MVSQSALDAALSIFMTRTFEIEAQVRLVAEGIQSESEVLEMFHDDASCLCV